MSLGESRAESRVAGKWPAALVFALASSVGVALAAEALLLWTHYRPLGAATLSVATALGAAALWPVYSGWLEAGRASLKLRWVLGVSGASLCGLLLRAAFG
jgi:hypothetical protein